MDVDDQAIRNIETCRRINRSASAKYVEHGVPPIDAAIGAIYSAHDLAMAATAEGPAGAIEWMRTALDTMERQLLKDTQPI